MQGWLSTLTSRQPCFSFDDDASALRLTAVWVKTSHCPKPFPLGQVRDDKVSGLYKRQRSTWSMIFSASTTARPSMGLREPWEPAA